MDWQHRRQEGVLGNGACDDLLVDVVFKFVLVGVFAVSRALRSRRR